MARSVDISSFITKATAWYPLRLHIFAERKMCKIFFLPSKIENSSGLIEKKEREMVILSGKKISFAVFKYTRQI